MSLAREAVAAHGAGNFQRAAALLRDVVRQAPTWADAWLFLADSLACLKDLPGAEDAATRALAVSPRDGRVLQLRSQIRMSRGDKGGAVDDLRALTAAEPRNVEAWRPLAWLLHRVARFAEAADAARSGLALAPADPDLHLKHAVAWLAMGRADRATAAYEQGLSQNPGFAPLAEGAALGLNYAWDDAVTPERVLAAHKRFGELIAKAVAGAAISQDATPTPAALESGVRIRVGLLSPDLRTHSVAFFVRAIAEHHDRGLIELRAYHTNALEDAVSESLKRFIGPERWRNVHALDDAALVRVIREDRTDVLVDLCGLMRDHRLGVLARRAAPVQVTYCGYPNTTGVPGVDVRLVDALTDPPEADALHTERLERLEGCFLCYAPPVEAAGALPPIRPRAGGGPDQPVTLGCFNALMKLNDRLLRLWARVLAEAPRARLLIKARGLEQPAVREDFVARATASGLPADRIEIAGATERVVDHLDTYNRVDLAMDSYPYHGTTTTCEALLMGVPVLSLINPRPVHAGRVGLSLLSAVGLARDLCVDNEQAFVARAAELVADDTRRASLRTGLRERFLASPVCDGVAFGARWSQSIAAIYRTKNEQTGRQAG